MSKRRKWATLFILVAVGFGIFLLFKQAPITRTLYYDLGRGHEEVSRLEVRISQGPELVRQVEWSFSAGEAPRRISHKLTLPAAKLTIEFEIQRADGSVDRERRDLDGSEPGDVVYYLEAQ